MTDVISLPNGLKQAPLLLSGSPDSSSPRPSSLQPCRTSPVSTLSLSTSSSSTSRSSMSTHLPRSPKSQMMVFTPMDYSWRVPDGTAPPTFWTIRSPSSSTQKCHLSGSCPNVTELRQLEASTTALSTRCCPDQELCRPLVTQLTTV